MICLGNTPVKPFIFTAPQCSGWHPVAPCPAPCDCCNICALHKAAAYSDCCRRNATRAIPVIWNRKTILPTPCSMGHVTHVLACRLPPMLLLAFRIAFVLLLFNPANSHHPCAPRAACRLARISFLGCQVRHISQFMSSFSSKYLHQLRATVVMHMPGLSSFVLLHIYIL